MTKYQAWKKAHELWTTPGTGPTDRVAMVTLRRKTTTFRYEVGFYLRGDCKPIIMGRGITWEGAFENARHNDSVGWTNEGKWV